MPEECTDAGGGEVTITLADLPAPVQQEPDYIALIKAIYDIALVDGDKAWTNANAKVIYESLNNMDSALLGQVKSLFGGRTLKLSEYSPTASCPTCTYGGWTSSGTITFYTTDNEPIRQMNVYHEFGHLIDSWPITEDRFSSALGAADRSFITEGGYVNSAALLEYPKVTTDLNYSQVQAIQASNSNQYEQWGDVFANYVAGNINMSSPQGLEMARFVNSVLIRPMGVGKNR